jgi:hypothetical protein
MSDTPRTDYYTKKLRSFCDDEFVPIEFARQLERELTAVTAERDEYKDLLIRVYDDLFVHRNMGEAIRDLKILMGAVQLTDALAAVKGGSDE